MLNEIHLALRLPKDDQRMLSQVTTAAISPWALTTLLKIYERRQAGASFEFYQRIKDLPDEGTIRGQMFQAQLLKYLNALKEPQPFTVRRLTSSDTDEWTYPGPTENSFSHSSTFFKSLEDAVTQEKPLHLVPKQPNFPAVASILYTPGEVLTGIQVTVDEKRPVAVVGLQRIQSWLKEESLLATLRPSVSGNHWRLIFVVPEGMAATFRNQPFKGKTGLKEWSEKVDQYVLGIKEDTLWARTHQLSSSS